MQGQTVLMVGVTHLPCSIQGVSAVSHRSSALRGARHWSTEARNSFIFLQQLIGRQAADSTRIIRKMHSPRAYH